MALSNEQWRILKETALNDYKSLAQAISGCSGLGKDEMVRKFGGFNVEEDNGTFYFDCNYGSIVATIFHIDNKYSLSSVIDIYCKDGVYVKPYLIPQEIKNQLLNEIQS